MPYQKRLNRKTRNDPDGVFRVNNELKPLIQRARNLGAGPSIPQIIESNRFVNINKQNDAWKNISFFRDFGLCPDLNPTGGPRITFTRASAAIRVSQAGLIEFAPENIALWSEDFGNSTWAKTRSSVTTNITSSPKNNLTADKFIEDSSVATNHIIAQSVTPGSSTPARFSVFLKASERSFAFIQLVDGSGARRRYTVIIDLSLGVAKILSTQNSPLDTSFSVSSVGNGWYRLSAAMRFESDSTGSFIVIGGSDSYSPSLTAAGEPSYTGDGASGFFIWGAQLERSNTAREYIPATSAAVYGPRFDYDPITRQCKGLLIEEARTNLILRSEEFDNASWTKFNSSVSANSTTSPDGNLTADTIVENTATNSHSVFQQPSISATTSYIFSVFVKASSRSWISLYEEASGSGTGRRTFFNVSTGTIGTTNANHVPLIISYGNGWYRCSISLTSGTAAVRTFAFEIASSDNTQSYTGDGTSGFFIWGAQLEAGAFATSYIPTTSATVTRSADICNLTGNDLGAAYNLTNSSAFFETLAYQSSSTNHILGFSNSSGSRIQFQNNNILLFAIRETPNATGDVSIAKTLVASSKIALGINPGAYFMAVDTNLSSSGTSTNVIRATAITFGYSDNGYMNGWVKKITLYPRRLSNATLQSLTG